MLKKALELWKKERIKKGTTLHRRLLLFFSLISVSIILIFTLLLSLFGINGKQAQTVQNHLNTELSIIYDKIDADFGRISLGGISIAERISERSDDFFHTNNVKASDLQSHPKLIEPLLATHMQTLLSTVNSRYCGGVFLMLDATVNPNAENADTAKAGVFLKKTQPTATSVAGVEVHCLRGPSQVARDNDIMLIGQWKMEFDITGQTFFTDVMETARNHPELDLSRLYYWTGRVTLKGNSESGFLLCVPLRASDGTVFGLCGIEVSDRLFKSVYTPEGGSFENIFTVMAPVCEDGLCTSKGLLAGNSYLTGKQWQFDLSIDSTHDGFTHYAGGEELYAGKSKDIRLYPNASPYAEEAWSVSILMPHRILHSAVEGNSNVFLWTVLALLVISLVASFFVSRRYIKPVNEALDSIRSTPHEERKKTAYTEINDLFEYLAARDREHEDEVQRLHGERQAVQTQYEQVQTYVTHLADERMPEVDEDDFEMFLKHLHTLTPKEREIFDYYLAGKKAKEIMELAVINQNTLKYHNKNIYSKLGVTSRKQLLEYAALMKYRKED